MVGVVIIMLFIFFIKIPNFLRNKMYRELWAFSFLWAGAFVYASLVALKVPLPTVVETLKCLYSLVNYFPQ